MGHHGFPKQGIRTGRVVNWAQVCVKFSWRKRRSQQIPYKSQTAKYGSYPSKNIPYFIHLLSLHVFFRISGLTLQISGLALPIWGCATNKKNVLKMFCGIYNIVAELLKSYINCPATNPSVDVRKSVKWDALFDMYKTKIATLIYKIFHRITPSSLERLIIQRGQNKYDLCHITIVSYHHHRVWIKVVVISGRICWSFN